MHPDYTEGDVDLIIAHCERSAGDIDYMEFVNMAIVKPDTIHAALNKIHKAAARLGRREKIVDLNKLYAKYNLLATLRGDGHPQVESVEMTNIIVKTSVFPEAMAELGLSVQRGVASRGDGEVDTTSVRASLTERQFLRLQKLREKESSAGEASAGEDVPGIEGKDVKEALDKIRMYRASLKQNIVSGIIKTAATKSFTIYPVCFVVRIETRSSMYFTEGRLTVFALLYGILGVLC